MHVKTLGYPIGCQPEIYNEDYQGNQNHLGF